LSQVFSRFGFGWDKERTLKNEVLALSQERAGTKHFKLKSLIMAQIERWRQA
jgi:hypothetical protein